MKRSVILLIFCLSLCIASTALAKNDIVPFASDLIKQYSVSISCSNSGTVTATASIVATKPVDKVGFSLIRIEEKQGNSWKTVKSTTNVYRNGANRYSKALTYQGTSGKQYRAYAKFYVKNGSSSDSRTKYSSTITGK